MGFFSLFFGGGVVIIRKGECLFMEIIHKITKYNLYCMYQLSTYYQKEERLCKDLVGELFTRLHRELERQLH